MSSQPAPAPANRLQQLQAMLEREPADAFLLYAIALEHKKLNEPQQAIAYLDRALQSDPGHCYAYYQKGQVLEASGDADGARRVYQRGIEVAKQKGDEKARGELEGALEMIGE